MNNKNLIFLILTISSSCMEISKNCILSNQNNRIRLISQNIVTNSFIRRAEFLSTDNVVNKITAKTLAVAKKKEIKVFAVEIIAEIITEITEKKEEERNFSELQQFWSLPQLGDNDNLVAKTPNNLSNTKPPLLSLNSENLNSETEAEISSNFDAGSASLSRLTSNENSSNATNEASDFLSTRTLSDSSSTQFMSQSIRDNEIEICNSREASISVFESIEALRN